MYDVGLSHSFIHSSYRISLSLSAQLIHYRHVYRYTCVWVNLTKNEGLHIFMQEYVALLIHIREVAVLNLGNEIGCRG
jgi:hypothetical protein